MRKCVPPRVISVSCASRLPNHDAASPLLVPRAERHLPRGAHPIVAARLRRTSHFVVPSPIRRLVARPARRFVVGIVVSASAAFASSAARRSVREPLRRRLRSPSPSRHRRQLHAGFGRHFGSVVPVRASGGGLRPRRLRPPSARSSACSTITFASSSLRPPISISASGSMIDRSS